MNVKRVLTVASLTLTASVVGVAPAHASLAQTMVARMNAQRAAHGLGPLHMSSHMNRGAYRWAHFLMRRNWLGHASLTRAHAKGEIIELHSGGRAKVGKAISGWMHSPGHRAVLLAGRFHRVGVGRSSGSFGGRRTTIWVARFN